MFHEDVVINQQTLMFSKNILVPECFFGGLIHLNIIVKKNHLICFIIPNKIISNFKMEEVLFKTVFVDQSLAFLGLLNIPIIALQA